MTNLPPASLEPSQAPSQFNRGQALRSIGFSIFISAVCPYLIYRVLEPQFPPGSLTPLLISTVFPLLGIALGFAMRRMLDYIAVISLVEISISVLVTLVAANIELALVARALQGTLTGLFFLLTVAVRRPLIYYVSRQFVAAGSPAVLAGFESANQRDEGRTFRRLTLLWGIVTILVSLVNLTLAVSTTPANYLLIAPILSIGTNAVLAAWTVRYSTNRLRRIALSGS